jgi:peptidyl-prolyl cis-trans isomerase C
MLRSTYVTASILLAVFAGFVFAAPDNAADHSFVAKQGSAVVYAIDVDAHVAPMKPQDRAGFINNPKRIEQMLGHMLVRRNLAIEARALKLDQDPVAQREIELAAESILMRRRLDLFREQLVIPDLTQLAKERYLADAEKFRVPDQVEVTHILLKPTEQRDEAAVVAQLKSWREDIIAGRVKIEDLAADYSDEPAAKSSRGVLAKAALTRYVQPFADAVRALRNAGDLSEPVKTDFGWHLIQLNSFEAGKQLSFDEVKDRILSDERSKYIAAEQEKYVLSLKDLPIEASEETIVPLRDRYSAPKPAAPSDTGAVNQEQPSQ